MDQTDRTTINCAVIGTGAFGKHYLRLLQNDPRATLRAVASPSSAERSLDISPAVKRHADASDVFGDPDIDAVVIATPLSTHAALTITALEAGKHVLLEKPFVSSPEEAAQIEKTVRKTGRVFMLAHQYLYNDHIAALKREFDGGRIGRVRYIHAEQLYPGPLRFDVGCFREAATHEVALIDHLFSPGQPSVVLAGGIDLSGGTREDFAAATLRYKDGLIAHIVTASYSPVRSRRMIFGGEKGMALFDDRATGHKVSFFMRPYPFDEKRRLTSSVPLPDGDTYIPEVLNGKEPLRAELEHFFDCIKMNSRPRSDIDHAVRVSETLFAVSRALANFC